MKIYFALNNTEASMSALEHMDERVHVLSSVLYLNKKFPPRIKRIQKGWLYIDSGAFSVWTQGGTIDIDKYCRVLVQLSEYFPSLVAINLDVIPGRFRQKPTDEQVKTACDQSWENYEYIKSRVPCPIMPVFHQHDDWEWLDRYLETDCPVLGISPANDESNSGRIPFLDRCFSVARQRKRLHGLAVTGWELMKRYPWYSVDSASWMVASGYGRILVLKGKRLTSIAQADKNEIFRARAFSCCGGRRDTSAHQMRLETSARALIRTERYLTEVWAQKGVVWDDKG